MKGTMLSKSACEGNSKENNEVNNNSLRESVPESLKGTMLSKSACEQYEYPMGPGVRSVEIFDFLLEIVDRAYGCSL